MFKGFTAVQLLPFQFSVAVTAGYLPKAKTAVFDAPAPAAAALAVFKSFFSVQLVPL